jgi:coniferyl-aldehyde dehydrogenase
MNSPANAIDTAFEDYTMDDMNAILKKQRDSFLAEGFVSYETRIDRLDRLENLLHENQDALVHAMSKDFGHRSWHQSVVTDFYGSYEAIKHQKKELKKWMKPEKRRSPFPLGLLGKIRSTLPTQRRSR